MSLLGVQKDASRPPMRQVDGYDSFPPLGQSHAVAAFHRQASDRPYCVDIMEPAKGAPSRYT